MTEPGETSELTRIRRRTIMVLSAGQILGGVSFGATVSLGAVLTADLSGNDALSGLAAAGVTLGAAAFALPLASFARQRGRRIALSAGMLSALVGVILVVTATHFRAFPLLLIAFALIGAGQAANLQSRYAATDLSTKNSRGRDLSLVVWATTVGAVLGPNLVGPGERLGEAVGMPALTGPYLFTAVAQVLAVLLYLVALRPDPLLMAQKLVAARDEAARRIQGTDRPRAARYAIIAIAGSHGVMVSVMAMTPVHLLHHGAALEIIGLTISLHIAGMYAFAPVFGLMADKWGRLPTILVGQAVLTASLLVAAWGAESNLAVTVALILLGLGWSASTVAASTLLTEASAEEFRTSRQGRGDLVMNLVGAGGAIVAGVILGWIGYGGLALVALAIVATIVLFAPSGRMDRA